MKRFFTFLILACWITPLPAEEQEGGPACDADSLACRLAIISAVEMDARQALRRHAKELQKLVRIRLFYELIELQHEYEELDTLKQRHPPDSAAAKQRGYIVCGADTASNACATALHIECSLHGLGRLAEDKVYAAARLSIGPPERLKILAQDAVREMVAEIAAALQRDRDAAMEAAKP